jgi:hypothetical protein
VTSAWVRGHQPPLRVLLASGHARRNVSNVSGSPSRRCGGPTRVTYSGRSSWLNGAGGGSSDGAPADAVKVPECVALGSATAVPVTPPDRQLARGRVRAELPPRGPYGNQGDTRGYSAPERWASIEPAPRRYHRPGPMIGEGVQPLDRGVIGWLERSPLYLSPLRFLLRTRSLPLTNPGRTRAAGDHRDESEKRSSWRQKADEQDNDGAKT